MNNISDNSLNGYISTIRTVFKEVFNNNIDINILINSLKIRFI